MLKFSTEEAFLRCKDEDWLIFIELSFNTINLWFDVNVDFPLILDFSSVFVSSSLFFDMSFDF